MIIEFIGSTGAGKTTLIKAVQRRLAESAEVTTSFDLMAEPLGLGGIRQSTAKNLIQEFVGLPFFVGSLPRNKDFVVFTMKMLARQPALTVFTLNNLRSMVRKIGVHEKIRRQDHERLILVDEGTVLSAHNIFVYSSAVYTREEIARFARLIPLPDVIVYVRAPLDSLIKRSLERKDPPREMRSKDRTTVEKYVKRAVGLFEQLLEIKEIQRRVLIVDNPEAADNNNNSIVDDITGFLLNGKAAVRSSIDIS